MAAALFATNYLIAALQDHVLGATAYAPPATLYIELFKTCPDMTGTGAVIADYTGYLGRYAVTNNTTNWPASANQTKSNAAAFYWGINTGASQAHAGYGVYDAPTGGNLLFVVQYAFPVTSLIDDEPFIAAGNFNWALANTLTTPANGGVFPSDYLIAKLQDLVLGAVAFTPPVNVYVARCTATPTAAGGGTESAYTGYSRDTVVNNTTNWPNSSGGRKLNGVAIVGPINTGSNDVETACALYDASTAGNLLFVLVPTASVTILTNQTPIIPAGSFAWIWRRRLVETLSVQVSVQLTASPVATPAQVQPAASWDADYGVVTTVGVAVDSWTDQKNGYILTPGGASKPTLVTSQFGGLNGILCVRSLTQWLTNNSTAALYQLANGDDPSLTVIWQSICITAPNAANFWCFAREGGASAGRLDFSTASTTACNIFDNGDSGSANQTYGSMADLTAAARVYAMVLSGTTQTLYVNGVAHGTVGAINATSRSAITRFNIGAFSSGGTNPADMCMRRLDLYASALSAIEVAGVSASWLGA